MSCLTFGAISVGTPHCFYEYIKENFPQEHETCHLRLQTHSLFMYPKKNPVPVWLRKWCQWKCKYPVHKPKKQRKKKYTTQHQQQQQQNKTPTRCNEMPPAKCEKLHTLSVFVFSVSIYGMMNRIGCWMCVWTRRIMASD